MEQETDNPPRMVFESMVYEGVELFKCDMERIKHMEIFDDDVFVCSFPRSGTTLTQEMTYLIQTLDFDTALSTYLNDRVPWIDGEHKHVPTFRSVDAVEELKRPRTVKCHLPYDFLPNQLKDGKGKVVYTSRNPKDVVQSFYRLMMCYDQLDEGQQEFEQYVDDFAHGKIPCGSWADHVLGYWMKRDCGNIMFTKYENTVHDLSKAVQNIAGFLGKSLTEDDVTKISEHCHINQMRQNPTTNGEYLFKYMHTRDGVGKFINKGQPGIWRDYLTSEMSDKLDVLIKRLDGSGLSYDFC